MANTVIARINGVEKVLSSRAASAYYGREVRKLTGQTSAQYAKEYDALRNRARNYEKVAGLPRGSINVGQLLLQQARGERYAAASGKEYRGNLQLNAVKLAPSASTGISKEKAEQAFERAQQRAGGDILDKSFGHLMERSSRAQAVYDQELEGIKSPTYAQRLAAYKKAAQVVKESDASIHAARRYAEKYGFDPEEY